MPDLIRMDNFDILGLAFGALKRALGDVSEARAALVRSEDLVAEGEETALKGLQKTIREHMRVLIDAAQAGGQPVLLRPLDISGRRIVKRFRDPIYPGGPGSEGLVFESSLGDAIVSPITGVVCEAGILRPGATWGKRVAVKSPDGKLIVWVCHMDAVDVSIGEIMNAGDVIGRAGRTGNAVTEQVLMVCQVLDGGISLPNVPFPVADPWPMLFEKHPSDVYYLEAATVEK